MVKFQVFEDYQIILLGCITRTLPLICSGNRDICGSYDNS